MTEIERKELLGRYAAKIATPGIKREFTALNERYDALATGLTPLVEEYKAYNDPKHPRPHNHHGYTDFQVDYSKCIAVKKAALNMYRDPLLEVFFSDYLYVWNLNRTDWEKTGKWIYGNKNGTSYGEKEYDLQAFFKFGNVNENGIVYKWEIPDGFWERVIEAIRKDYPDF